MASDWDTYPISDFVTLSQGLAINAKSKYLLEETGLPLLRITDLINGTQVHFVNEEKAPPKCIATDHELIYTRTGQVGLVYRNKVGVVHNNCFKVIPSPELDKDFLYWFLFQESTKAHVNAVASGSVQKDLNHAAFLTLSIPKPELSEQKAIASILDSLDDKIELNRQMNETLEAMAQALFKSWFVDFDPVIDNALAAGNAIPDELLERAELRKAIEKKNHSEIQSLFPDEFEFTEEMGWIPKGWENGILADICSYGKGKINTSELTLENYISTENMNKEKSGISHAANIASTNQVPKFSVGQTLISNIRPYFKKIWLASFSGGRSNDVLSFQAHNSVANEYLFNLLYQDSFFDYMTATSKGTKMPRGDKAAIMSWSVAIPSSKLMEEFSELAKPMYLANNLRSLQTIELAKLRDTLLPKLMSGELLIPDAARLVDEII